LSGGLFYSVRRLAQSLAERDGLQVGVIGLRDQWTDEDLGVWSPQRVRVLTAQGPARFGYAPEWKRILSEADAQICHTQYVWAYPSAAVQRWGQTTGRPWVVSARGMLDSWAMSHSRWKKRLVWWLFERKHLSGAACLHALAESEAASMRRLGLSNPIAVIPNGVDAGPIPARNREVAGENRLLFLGRLHPKKNLGNLIRAWVRFRSAVPAGANWVLVIAGWDDGGHEEELQRLVEELGAGTSIRFAGPLHGSAKEQTLAGVQGFVLPSLSEGLPVAVLEAWAAGVPVLMTRECNLPEGFAAGAAMETGTDVESLAVSLERFAGLKEAERRAMGDRGHELVTGTFSWKAIAGRFADLYGSLAGDRELPGWVRRA
jgi:poly(glycerol-phosphate) alpha-glucosyltransferase